MVVSERHRIDPSQRETLEHFRTGDERDRVWIGRLRQRARQIAFEVGDCQVEGPQQWSNSEKWASEVSILDHMEMHVSPRNDVADHAYPNRNLSPGCAYQRICFPNRKCLNAKVN